MKPRNLVFVFADQWRRSAAGPYHDDPVYTPNIDAFGKEAVVCTGAVSSFPLCSPARASLLSGLYPLSTGVFTNCKPGVDVKLDENTVCISDVLHENGYLTGYIGKWHLDEPEISHDPSPRSGAGGWDAYTPPGKGRHGFDFRPGNPSFVNTPAGRRGECASISYEASQVRSTHSIVCHRPVACRHVHSRPLRTFADGARPEPAEFGLYCRLGTFSTAGAKARRAAHDAGSERFKLSF